MRHTIGKSRCGNAARTDLRGGRWATTVPTATIGFEVDNFAVVPDRDAHPRHVSGFHRSRNRRVDLCGTNFRPIQTSDR